MFKDCKWHAPSIFVITIGLALIILALCADYIGIGEGSKDLFGPAQWLMVVSGACMIIISFLGRKVSSIVAVNLLILLPALLLVDNLMFWGSSWLPANLVRMMSSNAQTKHGLLHENVPMAHDGNIWFFKPNSTEKRIIEGVEREIEYDEFGYRNPRWYITNAGALDVILLGDSFTQGSSMITMADYFRSSMDPFKVYSLGIGGQGIRHWQLHFKRYVNSRYFKIAPKVVILNFYGGNDIRDTCIYSPGVPDGIQNPPEKPSLPQQKFSFYGELVSIARFNLFYKFFYPPTEIEQIPEDPKAYELTYEALSEVVSDIRQVSSETVILLSYIATPGAIYGPDMGRCLGVTKKLFTKFRGHSLACDKSAIYQAENTKMLHDWADQLDIYYVDPILELRRYAEKKVVHMRNDPHFSDEGNRIYSEVLTRAINQIINQQSEEL